ncbi:Zona pellucida-binding protein 2 [Heterocephalus glaber]|uniref:Zona pellucida-binding protein 2 n=1 Tax=Heterocephalus glaber TaxID=10181 RepID=G5BRX8_HETGA|nr:Zona pellucida-binding protein 2 [Heterocephalus glaber]
MRAWLLLSAVLCYLARIAWSRSSLLSEKGLVFGKIGHPGNNRINITKTGRLILKDFLEHLSGLYKCAFSYKTIKAETQQETVVKKRYDFMVFVVCSPGTFSPDVDVTCQICISVHVCGAKSCP